MPIRQKQLIKEIRIVRYLVIFMIFLLAIFLATLYFKIESPAGQLIRTYSEGGGGSPLPDSATYVSPTFNTLYMIFRTTISDRSGVSRDWLGFYNVTFYLYNHRDGYWNHILDSSSLGHTLFESGTPTHGTFIYTGTQFNSQRSLTLADCSKGYYIEWRDNNYVSKYVGNGGIIYQTPYQAQDNAIPFQSCAEKYADSPRPAFSTTSMNFNVTINDISGVQQLPSGRYNVAFRAYSNHWRFWYPIADSGGITNPPLIDGSTTYGTYQYIGTKLDGGLSLSFITCSRGYYIGWNDINGVTTWVGIGGVYPTEAQAQDNAIPFSNCPG